MPPELSYQNGAEVRKSHGCLGVLAFLQSAPKKLSASKFGVKFPSEIFQCYIFQGRWVSKSREHFTLKDQPLKKTRTLPFPDS